MLTDFGAAVIKSQPRTRAAELLRHSDRLAGLVEHRLAGLVTQLHLPRARLDVHRELRRWALEHDVKLTDVWPALIGRLLTDQQVERKVERDLEASRSPVTGRRGPRRADGVAHLLRRHGCFPRSPANASQGQSHA